MKKKKMHYVIRYENAKANRKMQNKKKGNKQKN